MSKKNSHKKTNNIPTHIVLLPDGNRRWAKEKGLSLIKGYKAGFENTKKFSNLCQKRGVKVVKVRIIGQRERLPLRLQKVIKEVEKSTKDNKGFLLNLAVSYSGRWDVLQAIQKIIEKKISAKKINEALFNNYLATVNLPTPDLIIRTGKERRLSNFLLWQAAYSELYFSDKYWPDFDEKDFNEALKEYSDRQRRYGK